jgi:hypothetical protein
MPGRRSQVVGVLLREADEAARALALAADFLPAGHFRWWRALPA